jgi:hypothetical protein
MRLFGIVEAIGVPVLLRRAGRAITAPDVWSRIARALGPAWPTWRKRLIYRSFLWHPIFRTDVLTLSVSPPHGVPARKEPSDRFAQEEKSNQKRPTHSA